MYDVITIGSATRDVYLKSPAFDLVKSEKFSSGIGECLALGSKNEASEIFLDTGGGATNAAVTFGNLKLKVGVLSRVGHDEAANEIFKILKKSKVDTSLIQKDHRRFTSYSTLLLAGSGQRSVLVYRGASNFINWEDAPQNKMKTKWFYVTSLGGDIKLLKQIFDFARRKKIKIAWNPGKGELEMGFQKLKKFIKQTTVFNLNREEAAELTGVPFENLDGIIKKLSDVVKNVLVVTDGKAGAYAVLKRKKYFAASLGTKPMSTTGAGDAFGSGFVAGLILREDVDYALRLAILNSDGVIRKMGAKNGLLESRPRRKELKKVRITLNK
jgi:ribokinase